MPTPQSVQQATSGKRRRKDLLAAHMPCKDSGVEVQLGRKINKSGQPLGLLLPSTSRIELELEHNPCGIIATMLERRSQERFLDAELVMLAWSEDRTKLMQLGNVEDLSLNGMGVVVSNALPVGTAVTITYGDRDFTGMVRHQSPREEANFIGIEFDPPSRDTTLHFDPELLVRCS